MTKKELTSLMLAFFGGWLIIQMLVALAGGPLFSTLTSIFSASFGIFNNLWGLAIALVPALAYGLLAWFIIVRCHAFADYLLKHARIAGGEKIDGFDLVSLLPLLFSLLGLHYLIATAPSFLMSAVRWVAAEARAGSALHGADRDPIVAQHQAQMIYDGLVLLLALFVFRRPDLLIRFVAPPKKRPNQSPEPTAMSVTPPAAQESRQP